MKVKRGSRKVVRGRMMKRGGKLFCSTCPEMPQMMDVSPNGDENLEKLSRHLSALNIKKSRNPKSTKKSYIKF